MDIDAIKKLSRERPPAVVLADLSLVRPVAMAGIPIILGAASAGDEALLSRHVQSAFVVPGWTGAHARSSVKTLVQLGAQVKSALGRKVPLLYESDGHLDFLYRYRRELSEYFLFVLNDEELAWALYDKERFHEVASEAGIRVPSTCRSGREIEAWTLDPKRPVVVKPKRKTSYRDIQRDLFEGKGKARVFATRAALCAHPGFERHKDDVLVQEHIDGRVSDLVSFHGYSDETGRILASFCGKKSRTSPMFGGDSSFIELTSDASVHEAGSDVARRLSLKGPFKIDMIRSPETGELYTLEINARFNLWHHLGAVDGVNLPLVAYDYLVHGRVPAPAPTAVPRHRWVDVYRDYQAFREQRAAGETSLPRWLMSIADPRTIHAMFAWDDPRPFMAWAGNFIRSRRSDAVRRTRA